MDRKRFFAEARKDFGRLSQAQVEGVEALLDAWRGHDPRFAAYGLATAWLETGATMQPVKEYGGAAYHRRMYDIQGARPAKARELGNLTPGDGALFCGRGYAQLTGRTNYARAGKALGLDLIAYPDKAMLPDVAARIMVRGMVEGWFTGRKLSDFVRGGNEFDAVGARKIINGQDKAGKIAAYYRSFLRAILAGEAHAPPPPDIQAPEPVKPPASGGLFRAIAGALAALFRRRS